MKKQTILIVDDAPENIELLYLVLSSTYNIKVALNGEKALEIALKSGDQPDLILLDVMMPGMDGYEVCRQLKASSLTNKIPVIFISALGEAEDERKGFEVGAVDFIPKPVSLAIVRARVKTYLALNNKNQLLE